MTDRPIIFSAPMVRALLDGRKSQTRRILKPQPPEWVTRMTHEGRCGWIGSGDGHGTLMHVPYAVNDRLWVRETWRAMDGLDAFSGAQIAAQCSDAGYKRVWSPIQYDADGERSNWIADPHTFGKQAGRHRTPLHMPRWASRLTLVVSDVRVQRVQDISEADAQAEGLVDVYEGWATDRDGRHWGPTARASYRVLWNDLHGEDAWDRNDWVCALTFTVHRQNIDQMEPTND